jgi:hypothetical protein
MTETAITQRLSRYLPNRNAHSGFKVRDRDIRVLQLLYQFRFLDTELLWRLTSERKSGLTYSLGEDGKRRPNKYGFGKKALYRRLQSLYHQGFVSRHYATDEPIGRGYGGPRAIYGLGAKSASLLSAALAVPADDIRDIVEANQVKSPFLRHALLIAQFRVILTLACEASDGRVRLAYWTQGQQLRDSVFGVDEHSEEQKFTVYPDAVFGLEVIGKGRANFFFELDRGTMPLIARGSRSDLRKKVLGYWHYRKTRQFAERYHYLLDAAGSVSGVSVLPQGRRWNRNSLDESALLKGFTVLIVTPGMVSPDGSVSGRVANVTGMINSLGPRFSTSTLFWVSGIEQFNLEEPESVFSRLWITPNPTAGLQSLIE